MPVNIPSTSQVTGYYAADEPVFSGSLERLRGSRLVVDTPEPSVATGWVTTSPSIGQIIDAVQDASYRVVSVADAQALAQADTAIQPAFYRIARGSDGTSRRGDVVVQGLAFSPATEASEGDVPARFAPEGLWLNPQTEQWVPVSYDVATDTVTTRNTSGTDPNALPAPLVNGVRTVTAIFTLDTSPRLTNARGFSGPNTGASDRNFLEGNWELRAYNGADASYRAFVQSSAYALMRRDVTEEAIAAALAALPELVQVSFRFPAPGAQSQSLFIDEDRFVGTISLELQTSNFTNVSFKVNGVVVALPVAVNRTDEFTVSATSPGGVSFILIRIS